MKEILITSSVLILAVLLLRLLFRRTISRRAQYALWALVLLRLLIPANLPALKYSVLTAAEPVKQTQVWETASEAYKRNMPRMSYTRAYEQVMEEARNAGEDLSAFSGSELDVRAYERMMSSLTVRDALRLMWYVGMGFMAFLFLLANLRFALKLRRTRVRLEGAESRYPVYLCDDIPSPCLFGLCKPKIYVTSAAARDPETLRYVIAHEETHARHLDPLWSLLRSLCLVIWWFDPLVWLAAHFSKIDCELACDEGVLRRLGEEKRIPYGETLLKLIPVGRAGNPVLTATTMTAGKRQMKDRIRRIAEHRRPLIAALVIVVLLAAVVCACTFTGAQEPGTAEEPEMTAAPVSEGESKPASTPMPTPEPAVEPTLEPVPISLLEDRLAAAADRVFGTYGLQGSDFQISVEANGRLDEYTFPGSRYKVPNVQSSQGYRMKTDYTWFPLTESEASALPTDPPGPVLRIRTEEASFTVYGAENLLLWVEGDGTGHWFRPEPVGKDTAPLYDCFLGYAGQAEMTEKFYDRIAVPGTVTDFEEVARQVSEQYAALLLDRPDWCSYGRPYGAGVLAAELFDAYYGEDFPNFCFVMRLALDVDEKNELWFQAGPGLGVALEEGPYAGWRPWWSETTVGLVDGTWRLLTMGSGGARVWLPCGVGWDFDFEKLTTKQLLDLIFLTRGKTRHWNLIHELAQRPAEEVKAELEKRSEEQRQEVLRSMEDYNGEYSVIEGYGSFDPETYGISKDAPAFALLKAVSEYTPEDWDMLSREGQLNALYESLSQAAIGDGQVRRDMYVMTAFLHADGACAELLDAILREQYETDPDAWAEALSAFQKPSLLLQMADSASEGDALVAHAELADDVADSASAGDAP